jgi:hypothetical protein
MSNFLQRAAATVIQPQARLQPILGSIFAPSALRSSEAFLSAVAESATQTSSPYRHEPIATPSFDASRLADRDRLFPAIAQEDFSSHRSLNNNQFSLTTFNTPIGSRKSTHEHQPAEGSGRTSESLKPAASYQPQITAGEQTAFKPQTYEPLITAMQQPSPRLQPREPLPTEATIRSSRAEATHRSQPTQREPDEVHIHIGRIEVAAITQQAPRPAAAANRKSLNLGDYLKHGNGRPE